MNNLKQTLKSFGIKRELIFVGVEKIVYLEQTKVNVIFKDLVLSCFVLNYMIDQIDLIERAIFINLDKL